MKKSLSIILALLLCLSLITPTFAVYQDKSSYDDVPAKYVQELVDLTEEELQTLPAESIETLFVKAFENVPTSLYTESEMRSILSALSYGLKWSNNVKRTRAVSTNSSYNYTGDIGVAWIRDTDKSPFTLGELAGGFYSLEYDFLSPETISVIIAAGSSQSNFQKLQNAIISNLGDKKVSELVGEILRSLGVPEPFVEVSTDVVSRVLSDGYEWVSTADRNGLIAMAESARASEYVRVEFMYNQNSNMVSRISSYVNRGTLQNPSGDKYGFWYPGQYGINYDYAV